jgi:uncharacterized membrane protein YeaQ/YmgE (transglycosylase-associated protein family)
MHLSNQGLLVIIVVGVVAGWLAGRVMQGGGFGLIGDLLVGLVGAFIGDWLLPRLGIHLGVGIVALIINAFIGAVVLLLILRLVGGGFGGRRRWSWAEAGGAEAISAKRYGHRDQELTMSDTFERKVITPAEREARKVFKEADAAKAMTEHERAQKAFQENRERLKALRLAREAGDPTAKWARGIWGNVIRAATLD